MYGDVPDDAEFSVLVLEFYHQGNYTSLAGTPALAGDFFLNAADGTAVLLVMTGVWDKCHLVSFLLVFVFLGSYFMCFLKSVLWKNNFRNYIL